MRKWAFLAMAMGCISLNLAWAKAAAPQAAAVPSPTAAVPKKDRDEVFKSLDKDGDGKLSMPEFVGKKKGDKETAAEAKFRAKDKDGDGFLTLEEFKFKTKKKK